MGDLFIDAFDDLHISMRHAGSTQSPGNHIGYIRTNAAGNDVVSGLLFGQPEKEAPHVVVTPSQEVLVSNYDGRGFSSGVLARSFNR